MSLKTAYKPVIVKGNLIRHPYDSLTKTTLTLYTDNDEIIYLPSDLVGYDVVSREHNSIHAEIQVDILPQATENNRVCAEKSKYLDCKPSMFGWISRSQNKAWYESSNLMFSVLKPHAEDGFFFYGGHGFCIDPNQFPNVETMAEPIPAQLTLVSYYMPPQDTAIKK